MTWINLDEDNDVYLLDNYDEHYTDRRDATLTGLLTFFSEGDKRGYRNRYGISSQSASDNLKAHRAKKNK